jgi:hypothetical protein
MTDMDGKELERIAKQMNDRGHASMLAYETQDDLRALERIVANEWATAMRVKFGLDISNVRSNPAPIEPPDCFAACNGHEITIELTELVNGEVLDRFRRSQLSHAEIFNETQWTTDLLVRKIAEQLDKKNIKYARRPNFQIDALVIYSDETWLSPDLIQRAISETVFPSRHTIRNAFLIRTYVPGYAEHWPMFPIYETGSL